MKKEDVLKLFWRERKNSVMFEVLCFFLGVCGLRAFPSLLPTEKGVGEWMLAVFLGAIACGLILIPGYNLWKTYRTVRKVKAGDFEIIEDKVVAKWIDKDSDGGRDYMVCFETFNPEHPDCRAHNYYFVCKDVYESLQIGDIKYFLNGELPLS